MAETLVVVAIVTILAAFAFVNVLTYQRRLKLVEMDDTAKEIFLAAQDHLLLAETENLFDTKSSSGGKIISTSAGGPVDPLATTAQERDINFGTQYKDNVYIITWTPDHPLTSNSAASYMLPKGAIDDTLKSHYGMIRYNKKT